MAQFPPYFLATPFAELCKYFLTDAIYVFAAKEWNEIGS